MHRRTFFTGLLTALTLAVAPLGGAQAQYGGRRGGWHGGGGRGFSHRGGGGYHRGWHGGSYGYRGGIGYGYGGGSGGGRYIYGGTFPYQRFYAPPRNVFIAPRIYY